MSKIPYRFSLIAATLLLSTAFNANGSAGSSLAAEQAALAQQMKTVSSAAKGRIDARAGAVKKQQQAQSALDALDKASDLVDSLPDMSVLTEVKSAVSKVIVALKIPAHVALAYARVKEKIALNNISDSQEVSLHGAMEAYRDMVKATAALEGLLGIHHNEAGLINRANRYVRKFHNALDGIGLTTNKEERGEAIDKAREDLKIAKLRFDLAINDAALRVVERKIMWLLGLKNPKPILDKFIQQLADAKRAHEAASKKVAALPKAEVTEAVFKPVREHQANIEALEAQLAEMNRAVVETAPDEIETGLTVYKAQADDLKKQKEDLENQARNPELSDLYEKFEDLLSRIEALEKKALAKKE